MSYTHILGSVRGPVDHFRVSWTSHPAVVPCEIELELACEQHDALRRAIEAAGGSTRTVGFIPGCHDSPFVKDGAVLMSQHGERRALIALPRHSERAMEADRRAQQFSDCDHVERTRFQFEGGDVVRTSHGRYLLGHGYRSMRNATHQLASFVGAEVFPIALKDERLVHLDMAVAHLPGGELLVARNAISRSDLLRLHELPEVTCVAQVPMMDALDYALNVICIGQTIITSSRSARVRELLERRGYEVVFVALDEFHKSGGGAASLVAPVHGAELAIRSSSESGVRPAIQEPLSVAV